MPLKPGFSNFLWLGAGTLILLAIVTVLLHFHAEGDLAAQLAFKARRVELVTRMRLALASASEAEKSAVMSPTDWGSQAFADQTRSALGAVGAGRKELEDLLHAGGTPDEMDLLARFSTAFAEFESAEKQLLELAVKNTNLKAYSLAYGPAADTLREMDEALSKVVTENANPAGADALEVTRLADDARIGVLRIQTLLPPHIAEKSDQKMDELEAQMAREDLRVRSDLERLAGLAKSDGSSSVATAAACYARFCDMKAQILKLSRENTNVRALDISLNQQQKVISRCQDALAALERAIQQEPPPRAAYGKPV